MKYLVPIIIGVVVVAILLFLFFIKSHTTQFLTGAFIDAVLAKKSTGIAKLFCKDGSIIDGDSTIKGADIEPYINNFVNITGLAIIDEKDTIKNMANSNTVIIKWSGGNKRGGTVKTQITWKDSCISEMEIL